MSRIPPRFRSFLAIISVIVLATVVEMTWLHAGLIFTTLVVVSYDSYHSGYEDAIEDGDGE